MSLSSTAFLGYATNNREVHIGDFIIKVANITGPTSYATGGFAVAIPGYRNILLAVPIFSPSGYVAAVSGITSNQITIQVFYSGNSGTPLQQVAAGTALNTITFQVLVIGY